MEENFKQLQILEEQKYKLTLTILQFNTLISVMMPLATEPGDFDNLHKCWQYSLATVIVKAKNKLQKNKKAKLTIKISASEYYAVKEILDHIDNKELQAYIYAITASL